MEDYTKLYHLLFNAITDALEQMNAQNFGSAKETLVSACLLYTSPSPRDS